MKFCIADISPTVLHPFCQKWQITELALLGSILRDDFRPDSDIDILVTFNPTAPWTLLDLVNMEYELQDLLGREVDLIEKPALEKSNNWIRRNEILNTAQVIYSQPHELP